MKSEIFGRAIHYRNMIRFFYFLDEVIIEPYLISSSSGKKYLYGRVSSSNQIKKFEFSAITNIRVLRDRRFSPVIPIKSQVN